VCVLGDHTFSAPLPHIIRLRWQVELALKAVVWTPVRFWRESNFNKIDVVLVVGAIIGAILQATGVLTRQISVAFSFFRFVRLVRILRVIPGFGLTVGAFADILPVLLQYATVLMSSFYIFAIVGEVAHILSPLPTPPHTRGTAIPCACRDDVVPGPVHACHRGADELRHQGHLRH